MNEEIGTSLCTTRSVYLQVHIHIDVLSFVIFPPSPTDQVPNGTSKNLEDTLTDCDQQKMADSLMVKLAIIKDESSSDEESQEQKTLMFEDAASSAGSESSFVNVLYASFSWNVEVRSRATPVWYEYIAFRHCL